MADEDPPFPDQSEDGRPTMTGRPGPKSRVNAAAHPERTWHPRGHADSDMDLVYPGRH